jgi:hypothetical protein
MPSSIKLNLGCGSDVRPGWVNVDHHPGPGVDLVWNLDELPWPWGDDMAEEVAMSHILEHLGATPHGFLGIVKELWRVCRHGATVLIVVPHPRHDHFLDDPTHVRPITVGTLALFDQAANAEGRSRGLSNTPLGLMLGVDFRIEDVRHDLDEPWRGRHARGEMSAAAIEEAVRTHNNVILQSAIRWRAVKRPGDVSP